MFTLSFTDNYSWVEVKRHTQDWPGPRYSHSAAIIQSTMHVFGGLEKLNATSELWKWSFGEYRKCVKTKVQRSYQLTYEALARRAGHF